MNIAFDGSIFASSLKDEDLSEIDSLIIKQIIESLGDNDKLYIINYNGIDIDEIYYDKDNEKIELLKVYLGPYNGNIGDKHQWLFTYPELEEIGSQIIERSLAINNIDIYYIFDKDFITFNFIKKIKERGNSKVKFVLSSVDLFQYISKDEVASNYNENDVEILNSADAILSIYNTSSAIENCKDNIEFLKKVRQIRHLDNSGEEVLELFKELLSKNQDEISPIEKEKRYKVAMLTPMPPEKTGIADYSLERIPYWNKYFDVDIFTDNPKKSKKFLSKEYNIFQYDDFEKKVSNYDYIFYQMGNSTFHLEILKYIQKYPGIVVLHDYNLKELVKHLYFTNKIDEDKLNEILSIQYGENIDEMREKFKNDDKNIEINCIITANALGVIVHSEYAKNNLLRFNNLLPIDVVTHGSINYETDINSSIKESLRKKYNLKESDTVFGSFGLIYSFKRHYQLMEIFAKYINDKKDKNKYKLLLVGEIGEVDKFNEYYNRLLDKYDVKDNIVVTGYTDLDEFSNLMYLCDVVFNLRYPSNGETSGSLARLMMIGKPVVVTDIATFSELPDDTCIKISYSDTEKDEILSVFKEWETNKENLLEIGKNARRYMLDKCSLENNAVGYLSHLNKVDNIANKNNFNIASNFIYGKIVSIYANYFRDDMYINLNRELPLIAELIFRLQKKIENIDKKKLNIVFDGKILAGVKNSNANRSGIYFVVHNLLLEFLNRDDIKIYLFVDEFEKERTNRLLIDSIPIDLLCKINIFNNTKEDFDKYIDKIDVFFSPVYRVRDEFKKIKRIKTFMLLHDAMPILFPHFFPKEYENDSWVHQIVKKSGSEYYFSVSICTIDDYRKVGLPVDKNGYTITYNAASTGFYQCKDKEKILKVKRRYNIPVNKRYILSLSSTEYRKNTLFAIESFLKFIDYDNINDLVFVKAGAAHGYYDEEFQKAMEKYKGYEDSIILTGYIDDEDMSALYSGADFFIYPSLYEGFGMPLLEAMQCGTPVIGSNTSSMPEVVGDVGILIDPTSIDDCVNAMRKMYSDEKFRKEQSIKGIERAKEFSWSKTASQMIDVFFEKSLKNKLL